MDKNLKDASAKKLPSKYDSEFIDSSALDELFKEDLVSGPMEAVTFWIPADKKALYESLQNKTNRKFSKLIKDIIIRSVDTAAQKLG